MDNKKYLDKVIGSLVRSTKIDYDRKEIHFIHSTITHYQPLFYFLGFSSYRHFISTFSKYCRNQFGLTEEEIDYVWNEYQDIIKEKIKNNEQ
jgi:hypothetical protein